MRYTPANLIGGSYSDSTRSWAHQDTVNWLCQVAEVEGTRTNVMLVTPPGLSYFTQCGEGPIRGSRDVEGKLFVVSGNGLYEVATSGAATLRGTIPGVGRVSMSHNKRGYGNQLLIVNGAAGYVWDTSAATLTKITDSGYPNAVMADYLDHYMIQVEPFGRFWFHSNLDNALDYNTLDQYDAEASPDKIVGIAANQLEAVVFSQKTTEFFTNTGAGTNTFQSKRIVIERGCAGRHTIVKLDNTLMWLGNDGIFYRLNGYGAQPISPGPISEAIAGLDWENAFGFVWEVEGHKVAYWTFPDGHTWGYDVTQPPGLQWGRRESYGLNRWRLNTLTNWQGMWIGGDYRTGLLFKLEDQEAPHEIGDPIVRERTGPAVNDNQNAVLCPYVELIFDTGRGSGVVPADQLPPAVTITGDLPDGLVGDSGTLQYVVTGGVAPYSAITVLSGSLPPGATMDANGLVTYTYTTAGSYSWTVGGTDALGAHFSVADSAEMLPFHILAMADASDRLYVSGTGATWTQSFSGITGAARVITYGQRIVVFYASTAKVSNNYGASFATLANWPNAAITKAIVTATGKVYAIVPSASDATVYTAPSIDGPWTTISLGIGASDIAGDDACIIATGSTNYKVSLNGGAFGSSQATGFTCEGIRYGAGMFLFCGGGLSDLHRYSTNGATLTTVALPATAGQFVDAARLGDGSWISIHKSGAVGTAVNICRSANGTTTWAMVTTPSCKFDANNLQLIAQTGTEVIAMAQDAAGLFYPIGSTDYGVTWQAHLHGYGFTANAATGVAVLGFTP
jgi:hypothetical protein